MCGDALPVGLSKALRKGVGRSCRTKGDVKECYNGPPKKRPVRTHGNLPTSLWVCSVRTFANGPSQNVAGLVLPHAVTVLWEIIFFLYKWKNIKEGQQYNRR